MTLPKRKNWYHATTVENANAINKSGYLIPQEHQPGLSHGVFFTDSAANAGNWLAMRGHKDYVVFKIPRTRMDATKMRVGGANRGIVMQGVCMRYLDRVPVKFEDGTVMSGSTINLPPGVEVVCEGTKKLGFTIGDEVAFAQHFIDMYQQNPEAVEREINELGGNLQEMLSHYQQVVRRAIK